MELTNQRLGSEMQDEPIVDGSITVNDKLKFTVVLPQNEPGVVKEGIVRFVDLDATPEDSLFLLLHDSFKCFPFSWF